MVVLTVPTKSAATDAAPWIWSNLVSIPGSSRYPLTNTNECVGSNGDEQDEYEGRIYDAHLNVPAAG